MLQSKIINGYLENIKQLAGDLQTGLERLNNAKDRYLFTFIQKHWPEDITPNQLTVARIIIGTSLFFLLFNFRNNNGFIVLVVFTIGALTDLLDGGVARYFKKQTAIGAFIDPVADRMLILPVMAYVLIEFAPLLLFIVLFEIINAIIALSMHGKGMQTGSDIFGKTKMTAQSVALMGILLFWPHLPSPFFISLLWMSGTLMLMSIALKINNIRLYYAHEKIAENIQHSFGKEGIIQTAKR